MGNFYITISNGLLKDGHRQRMGESVWEYMWCLDKITIIDSDGVGWLLGKKPINLIDLAEDLRVHENTISRNLSKLEECGYIIKKLTPYGIILGVKKAKKRFNKNSETLPKTGSTQMVNPIPQMVNLVNTNGEPNICKIVSVDNTVDKSSAANAAAPVKKKAKFSDTTPMSLKEFGDWMDKSSQRHMEIVSWYADQKKPNYTTKGQWEAFIARNTRAARDLSPYTDDQIVATYKKLKEAERDYLTKWSLETLIRYLD